MARTLESVLIRKYEQTLERHFIEVSLTFGGSIVIWSANNCQLFFLFLIFGNALSLKLSLGSLTLLNLSILYIKAFVANFHTFRIFDRRKTFTDFSQLKLLESNYFVLNARDIGDEYAQHILRAAFKSFSVLCKVERMFRVCA